MASGIFELSIVIGSKTSLIFYCSLPTNNYIRKNLTNVFITIEEGFMQTSNLTFDKHKANHFKAYNGGRMKRRCLKGLMISSLSGY